MEVAPAWLLGAWRRRWIRRGPHTDEPLDVYYVQTRTRFGDVRIPRDRPRFSGGLADRSDLEMDLLAHQRGFVGRTTARGDALTWHRSLDFQPPDGGEDVGRAELHGRSLLEHAPDGSYTEGWWSLGSGDGRFLVLEAVGGGRLDQILVVAGDHFVYARNRAFALPIGPSLAELLVGATRDERIAALDCEVSHGLVAGGPEPWWIDRSTLPGREGTSLALPDPGWSVVENTLPADELRELGLGSIGV